MKRGRVLSLEEARRLKARNPRARWQSVADEFGGDVWPELNPSFKISSGQTIFTIGSCFARNIERHLVTLGCRVPMEEFHLPPEEFHGSANGAMNKFHPPAFRQCLQWTAAIFDRDGRVTWSDCEPLAVDWGDGQAFDLDMGATSPVSRERFVERRQHIYDIFSQAFSADCLMMTPGLIEAWLDRRTGLYMHNPPMHRELLTDRSRWEFEILSYDQCEADLLAAIDVVRARNPGVKVLVTTSPVPMSATFSGQDVRTANAYSKSVLRAACGAVAMQRPLVDYFPSYESATLSFPVQVWEPDRLHVSSSFVGKIVARMLDHYLDGVDEAARCYQAGRTFLMGGEFDQAEQAARKALAAQPDHEDARVLLGEALLRQDKCEEAERELRDLAERHPERADLRIGLARAIARASKARIGEALTHIEAAVALPSVGLSDFRAVSELVRRRAAPETAERLGRRAMALFPLHVAAHQQLADVLVDQGRRDEAIELLGGAVELQRVPVAMMIQLAQLLIEAGRGPEAAQRLNRVLVLEPKNAVAADLLAQIGRPEPAATARS